MELVIEECSMRKNVSVNVFTQGSNLLRGDIGGCPDFDQLIKHVVHVYTTVHWFNNLTVNITVPFGFSVVL